jgi:MFS family permease
MLGITMTVGLIINSGFGTALPKLVEIGTQLGHYGFFAIGLAVGAIQLLGSSAQFAGGHFADRGAAKRAYVAGLLVSAVVLPLVAVSSGWALGAAAVATIFLFEWTAPIETLFMARYSPAHRRGLVFGIRYGLATIGTPLGVWLVARLYDPHSGFSYLLAVLGGLSLAGAVAALFLPADKGAEARAGA